VLDADLEVCTECGLVHMEGGPGPADVDACSSCDGRLTDVELEDLVDLSDVVGI
jgi:hypothetical protein